MCFVLQSSRIFVQLTGYMYRALSRVEEQMPLKICKENR